MSKADEAIREFAEKYKMLVAFDLASATTSGSVGVIYNDKEMLSALTALISEHYYPKEKYNELLQQRDELKEALISMMWQFAYYGTKNNVAVMHTGGLSALEDAFVAIGLSDPITVADFEAAIKKTEKK